MDDQFRVLYQLSETNDTLDVYKYDICHHLISIQTGTSGKRLFTYNSNNQIIQVDYYVNNIFRYKTVYDYNECGQLTGNFLITDLEMTGILYTYHNNKLNKLRYMRISDTETYIYELHVYKPKEIDAMNLDPQVFYVYPYMNLVPMQ